MKKVFSIATVFLIILSLGLNSFAIHASSEYSISISAPSTRMVVGRNLYLTATVTPSGPTVRWYSGNEEIATVTNYGMVTALKTGTVVIWALCTDPTDYSTITTSITIQIQDSAGLKDNTSYYIMNYYHKRLISLSSAFDANNISVSSKPRSETNLSQLAQWRLHELSDHRFQLASGYSSSGRVLYRNANDNMIISDSINSEYSKFTIGRIASGFYQGLYYIMVANKYLTMNSSGELALSSSLTMYSYWSFMSANQGEAVMYGTDVDQSSEGSIDATVNYAWFNVAFDNGYTVERETNVGNETIYDNLSSDVCIISSHGFAGIMWCFDDDGNDNGAIIVHDNMVNSFGRNGTSFSDSYINRLAPNELADTRLIFYFGCSTGNDCQAINTTTYNLVDETFEKGAHCVIGLEKMVGQQSAFRWMDDFLEAIFLGNSINDAVAYANRECKNYGGIAIEDQVENDSTMPTYIVGDKYQYLK